MGTFQTIAITILSISFIVFIALFGRLPVFRKTPIGFSHRLLLKHLPIALLKVDELVTGRRLTRGFMRTGNYLMNEKHPLVLVFFVGLQVIGEILFIPQAWSRLSGIHHILIPILITLPHISLYYSATTSNAISTPTQSPTAYRKALQAYPYDYTLFHPGYFCSTCHHSKPARSKHCSLCKSCIQKHDHHCIWINNCVGRNNYVHFLALLVFITVLLLYASFLGYSILNTSLQHRLVPPYLTRGSMTSKHWSTGLSWTLYAQYWGYMIATEWQIGATTLLCLFCFPLSTGFLVYHTYLIWAGMTTNESAKWAEWRDDIADGTVWRATLDDLRRDREVRIPDGKLGDSNTSDAKGEVSGFVKGYKLLPEDVEPRNEQFRWPSHARAKFWVCRMPNEHVRPTCKARLKRKPPGRSEGHNMTVDGGAGTATTTHSKHKDNESYDNTRDKLKRRRTMSSDLTKKNRESHGNGEVKQSSFTGGDGNETNSDATQPADQGGNENWQTEMEVEMEVEDDRWTRVESLVELENIYDLGFGRNVVDALFGRD